MQADAHTSPLGGSHARAFVLALQVLLLLTSICVVNDRAAIREGVVKKQACQIACMFLCCT
eukprot:12426831-Karenia_brevis.AAC.2